MKKGNGKATMLDEIKLEIARKRYFLAEQLFDDEKTRFEYCEALVKQNEQKRCG